MNKNFLVVVGVALVVGAGAFVAGRSTAPQSAATPTAASSQEAKKERKILYYRNPMGLPDTSPVPKKDPMGMDYIPVYEGEEAQAAGPSNAVKISPDKVQTLGVRTERAERRALVHTVRAVGTVQLDERGLHTVAPKFEGWIERLYVNTTGQAVAKGQPLMEVYSPELVSAQREYLIARRGDKALANATEEARSGFKDLSDAALQRLRNWDVSEAQLRRLAETGEVKRTVTIVSPAGGVVMEKPSVAGKRFIAGEPLYQIASLGNVWVVADVFEQDLGQITAGQRATVRVNAYPDKAFEGRVAFIYPTLTAETRTAKVRVELPNPGGLLKPAMFGAVELAPAHPREALAVPESAVIDSGTRKAALVQIGEGRFEPRDVKTGARADGYVEVLEGVREGEQVVVRANFLIDAESNLKAALGGLSSVAGAQTAAPAPPNHTAEGVFRGYDPRSKSAVIDHDPIPSLKWPAMTMDFAIADPAIVKDLQPGSRIRFELEDKGSGEFAVTKIAPLGASTASGKPAGAAPAGAHQGH